MQIGALLLLLAPFPHYRSGVPDLILFLFQAPWEGLDWFTVIYRVGEGTTPCIPENLSEEGKDFLLQCFINDPKERAAAENLEGHYFVKVSILLHIQLPAVF